ncbi:MAG: family 43 glycosylhydrolase [Prolixibacteraceae bacterium]|nr:family 43 glycosylhydrolase [Prolixibacteraceae bacterium]
MKKFAPLLLFLFSFFPSHAGITDSISLLTENFIDETDPPLPELSALIDEPVSSTSVCKGPGKRYYLTGTTGNATGVNEGIKMWTSADLKNWYLMNGNGYVWTFENDGKKWQKEITSVNGEKHRALVNPKIHYIKNNFWITYTITGLNCSGILKSVSGRATGPYTDISEESPLVKGIKASLFEDTDSTVYFIWNGGLVHTMKNDMSGFSTAGPLKIERPQSSYNTEKDLSVININGTYYIAASQWIDIMNGKAINSNSEKGELNTRFDCIIASSASFFGPYSTPVLTIPHAGGSMLFEDFENNLWACSFACNDISAPLDNRPALIPLAIDDDKQLKTFLPHKFHPDEKTPVVFVSKDGNNKNGTTWIDAYTSLQTAIDKAKNGTQIWVARGIYEAPVEIVLRKGLYIYGGFKGDEAFRNQRDIEKNRVTIDGRQNANHVISIVNSSYIRIDGLKIANGYANGSSFQNKYGAGLHILRGGETIRVANCTFENNHAEQDAGALYASVGAAPLIINCTFRNNNSKRNGGAAAVYCNAANGYHTKFFNCTFDNNYAMENGGSIYFDTNRQKAGLLSIINCTLTNNYSQLPDGIISIDRTGSLILSNCTLCLNQAGAKGAVISKLGNVPAQSRIVNSIFFKNKGGSLFQIEGEARMNEKGELTGDKKIWVRFSNCLFYENEVTGLVERNFDGKTWKTVSGIEESILGKNIYNFNPGFINAEKGDFRLSPTSPARNKGTHLMASPVDGNGNPQGKNRLPCLGAY